VTKLDIDTLTKRYYVERDGRQVLALSDVSLAVGDGEFVAIVGPSGCGGQRGQFAVTGVYDERRPRVSLLRVLLRLPDRNVVVDVLF